MGMVTVHRTERDGFLIAYEGETMSEEEARERGLLTEPEAPKPRATRKKKATVKEQ